MHETDVVMGVVIEDASLTLDQVCQLCAVPPDWVVQRARAGLLGLSADEPVHWRFSRRELRRVREMRRLERDFDAVPELAALVADMIDEMEALRAALQRQAIR